jgi:signal transduction histidine kinase/integral membrane sensor domain MASE1
MIAQSNVPSLRPRAAFVRDEGWLLVAVAVAYYAGAEAAFAIGTLSDRIFAPFWPPNVILFCALMLVPIDRWWIYILAAFPAHVLAELRVGMEMPQLLVAFATNVLVAAVNAYAVRALVKHPPWFGDLRKTSLYVLVTALFSPALCALAGAYVPILGGGDPAHYWTFWAQWYAANALASVTLGPIALLAVSGDFRSVRSMPAGRLVEAGLLALALVVVCVLVFKAMAGRAPNAFSAFLLYAPLPIIVLATKRFGAKGASSAILIVTLVLIWRAVDGPTLFLALDAETNVFAMQAFLIGLSVPVLLLGASIDETHAAERTTRESEERMAFAATSANIGLWHYDVEKHAFWASDHCRFMFGIPDGKVVSPDSILKVVHPDDCAEVTNSLKTAVYSGRSIAVEFRIVPAKGGVQWILASGCAEYDTANRPMQVSGVFIDISARKTAEVEAELHRKELSHLTRVSMLGELSGAIAHELHQPLTAILSNAQAVQNLLACDKPNFPEVNEALEDIEQEAIRAGEVIHRLRRLLKKDESRLEAVALGDLVRSSLRLLHSELVSRGVKVKLQLAENVTPVIGDPVQLQQVVLNLIMNAAEAMTGLNTDRRVITVRSSQYGQRIEMTVEDRGSGIASENLPSLFQPFFSTKEHGLGLGLSICSTIVKSHGGELILINNKDGGATAIIRLPVDVAQVTEADDGVQRQGAGVLSLHSG